MTQDILNMQSQWRDRTWIKSSNKAISLKESPSRQLILSPLGTESTIESANRSGRLSVRWAIQTSASTKSVCSEKALEPGWREWKHRKGILISHTHHTQEKKEWPTCLWDLLGSGLTLTLDKGKEKDLYSIGWLQSKQCWLRSGGTYSWLT